jgi:hypothetical protein
MEREISTGKTFMSNSRISLVFRDPSDMLRVNGYKDLIHGNL